MLNGLKPEDRPLVCDCGSTDITTHKDIGCDIDPDGEEKQHIDVCNACGKSRLWVERWLFSDSMEAAMSPHIHWNKRWTAYPLHRLGL